MAVRIAALLAAALAAAAPVVQPQPDCGGRSANPHVACQADVDAMMAALPSRAPAAPAKPRRVLVLTHAAGYVHSSIPLAAKTIEALGAKTGAWTATTTYDPADINTANLAAYDLIFLDNTTGCFLDDPADAAATAARRAALLAFVRGGKGLAGIHAASDSYHGESCAEPMASAGKPLWPAFNAMIGGFSSSHWNDPQLVTVKIDDPSSPLTAMFHGPFEIRDETYVLRERLLLARKRPRADEHRLRADERRRQGERARSPPRPRLRAELDSNGRQRPRVLRSARPQ